MKEIVVILYHQNKNEDQIIYIITFLITFRFILPNFLFVVIFLTERRVWSCVALFNMRVSILAITFFVKENRERSFTSFLGMTKMSINSSSSFTPSSPHIFYHNIGY